jgi:outer membrane protein assembly factor BamA
MNRMSFVHLAMITVVCALGAGPAAAQNTRAESVSQERAAKAQTAPAVHEPGVFERTFTWVGNKMGDGSGESKDGLYPQIGGMIPGAGWLSAGPGYRQHLFGDAAVVNVSAAMSPRRYSMVQSKIEWPALFDNRLSIGAGARYQDFTQINYFGVGPDSAKGARTDYRLKNVDITGSATVRPTDWLSIGGRAGYIRGLDVAPGLGSIHPPTHDLFDDTTAPGLTIQPRYGHADVFVEADSRDVPGYPTSGGVYRLGLTTFHDLDGSGQSFRRVDADATQYVPLFHRNWIVAVRGRVALSQTGAGNEVPFYLMPTLGGRHTLRGYNNYRFRDRNAAFVSAEYRWPVFRMMDAALFADAGTVAPTAGGLLRQRLEHDYGFGLRFHTATRSVAGIDVAKSREGTRVSLSFTSSFGGSSSNVIPYVP